MAAVLAQAARLRQGGGVCNSYRLFPLLDRYTWLAPNTLGELGHIWKLSRVRVVPGRTVPANRQYRSRSSQQCGP